MGGRFKFVTGSLHSFRISCLSFILFVHLLLSFIFISFNLKLINGRIVERRINNQSLWTRYNLTGIYHPVKIIPTLCLSLSTATTKWRRCRGLVLLFLYCDNSIVFEFCNYCICSIGFVYELVYVTCTCCVYFSY